MAVILNASTSTGFVQSADTSGELVLQNNGTTRLTVNASGVTIPTLTATTVQGTIVQGTVNAGGTNPFPTSGGPTVVDFTGIPSWAKKITVMLSGVSLNGADGIIIQLGDSGGFETTGYVSGGLDQTASFPTSTTGFLVTVPTNANIVSSGSAVINNINGNTWVSSSITGSVSGNSTILSAFGSKTLSDVLTQIRIRGTSANTFDAGSINIQYEG